MTEPDTLARITQMLRVAISERPCRFGSSELASDPVEVRVDGDRDYQIVAGDYVLEVLEQSTGLLSELFARSPALLIDMLALDISVSAEPGRRHDYIWFEPTGMPGRSLLCVLCGMPPLHRRLHLKECHVAEHEQRRQVRNMISRRVRDFASGVFSRWLAPSLFAFGPHGFAFARTDGEASGSAALLVRVGHELTWPLTLPFDHFVRYPSAPYDCFARYKYVEWILTNRTWGEVVRDRARIDAALSGRSGFLESAKFIINDSYPHWTVAARQALSDAVSLFEQLNTWLQPNFGPVFLFNPPRDEVFALLADRSVKYLFANFHTVENSWQCCDGRLLDLAQYVVRKKLSHIELVMASHCQSLGDPTVGPCEESICRLLLNAGVRRTGGSMLYEHSQDYFCKLLHFCTDAAALGPTVFEAALFAQCDFTAFADRVDRYLGENGYPTIDREVTVP